MKNKEFFLPLRVYVEDTDAGEVVYYVNYLKFMERARTEFLRCYGIHKPALLTDELLMVVASAQIDYKKSARLDDQLRVTVEISKKARSYVVFRQRILRQSAMQSESNNQNEGGLGQEAQAPELIAEGTVKVACVSKATMKPSAFPDFFVAALAEVGE